MPNIGPNQSGAQVQTLVDRPETTFLKGGSGADSICGGDGNDVLNGAGRRRHESMEAPGNDTIAGGHGGDLLIRRAPGRGHLPDLRSYLTNSLASVDPNRDFNPMARIAWVSVTASACRTLVSDGRGGDVRGRIRGRQAADRGGRGRHRWPCRSGGDVVVFADSSLHIQLAHVTPLGGAGRQEQLADFSAWDVFLAPERPLRAPALRIPARASRVDRRGRLAPPWPPDR